MFVSLFNFVLDLSVTGAIIALFIIIVKKAAGKFFSARWHYVIWFLLLVKLIVPFTFSSSISVFNLIKPIYSFNQVKNVSHMNQSINSTALTEKYSPSEPVNSNLVQNKATDISRPHNSFNWTDAAAWAWLAGVLISLLVAAFSYSRTFMRTEKASLSQCEYIIKLLSECTKNNKSVRKLRIRLSYYHTSPFIIGAFRPSIVIPSNIINSMDEESLKSILMHELMHLKHHDNTVRIVCYLIQAIHWFNPVIWFSLRLMSRDCEIACDSSVISNYSNEMRKEYAILLVKNAQINTQKNFVRLTAFSESNLRKRIVNIVSFKKQSPARYLAAFLVFTALTVVLLTGATASTNSILSDSFDNVKSIYFYNYLDISNPNNSTLLNDTLKSKVYSRVEINSTLYDGATVNAMKTKFVYYFKDLNILENKDTCRLFYDLISKNSGKTLLVHNNEFENPALSVEITYNDGHTDYFYSNSDGSKVYRVLGNANFLECMNSDFASIIKKQTLKSVTELHPCILRYSGTEFIYF